MRFQLFFPDTYPDTPPLITFSSDVFHPLVVPLTTYTFSSHAIDSSTTVSASDEHRLAPGAFSLRYGFPDWFRASPTNATDGSPDLIAPGIGRQSPSSDQKSHKEDPSFDAQSRNELCDRKTIIVNVLRHIQEAFENEMFLDNIPLATVGDPSAWHAWAAHRGQAKRQNASGHHHLDPKGVTPSSPRTPGEWKWDGVWESRVSNGIEASISEAALFGSTSTGARAGAIPKEAANMDPRRGIYASADRQIRFSRLSNERYEELKAAVCESGSPVPS